MKAYQLRVNTNVKIWDLDSKLFSSPTEALVSAVEYSSKLQQLQVFISGDPLPWIFNPSETVRWPRRRNGKTVVHMAEVIPVTDVVVGDVIPTYWGWQDTEVVGFSEGFEVIAIRWFGQLGEWHIHISNATGAHRIIIDGFESSIHSQESLLLPYHQKIDPNKEPAKHQSIKSGIYRNQAGEEKVFRLPGLRGRPSLNMLPQPGHPDNPTSWDDWELVQGKPHPDDPRYN